MYAKCWKRVIDFTLSLIGLMVLLPLLFALTVVGAIVMKGNPFFTQLRPGKDEKIFRLVKFRTMTCEKDKEGNLLPDEKRLTKYGKFLRSTSLDELPELWNILKGDMALVGPRPLLVEYLPYYTEAEKHRHDVRPGLTGYSQIHGRNYVKWEDKFKMDVWYVNRVSLKLDIKILVDTVRVVLERKNIETASSMVHEGILYQPLNIERSIEKGDNVEWL